MTFDEYHVQRRALQRRMWNEQGQWIGGTDAEAAQIALRALDAEWMHGPAARRKVAAAEEERQRRYGKSESWGT